MGKKSKDRQPSQPSVTSINNLTLPLLRAEDNTPYTWGTCETTGRRVSIVLPNTKNGLEALTGTPTDMFPAICCGDTCHNLQANCRVALIEAPSGGVEAVIVQLSCQERQCPIQSESRSNGKKGKRK